MPLPVADRLPAYLCHLLSSAQPSMLKKILSPIAFPRSLVPCFSAREADAEHHALLFSHHSTYRGLLSRVAGLPTPSGAPNQAAGATPRRGPTHLRAIHHNFPVRLPIARPLQPQSYPAITARRTPPLPRSSARTCCRGENFLVSPSFPRYLKRVAHLVV
jgi:hypothetical protein